MMHQESVTTTRGLQRDLPPMRLFEADWLGQQSLNIYQGINDRGGLDSALNLLASVALVQGDDSTA